MSLQRVNTIALNGFREVIRDRILYFIGFYALLMVLAVRLLPDISLGTHAKVLFDFGLAIISLLSAVVAVFVGTGLINKEIEKRTLLVLIPKPLSKAELIIGKHLGLSGVLLLMISVMTLLNLIFLSLAKAPYNLNHILLSQVYLFLEVVLLIAVALLFGSFTSSILATLLSLSIYLMGHISIDLLKLGALSKNEGLKNLTQAIYLILPDLERLNFKNAAFYGNFPDSSVLFGDAIYGIIYTLVLLSIAILIFSRREF